jgi:RHS repeat-associated protein
MRYDGRGNVINNGQRSFEYNQANQMIRSEENEYTYDGHDRRVKIEDSLGTRYSFYSLDGQLLFERVGQDERENYYLNGQWLVSNKKGILTYIHRDLLGNTAAKTDVQGWVLSQHHYQPFGKAWGKAENEMGYTGHPFDTDLGLNYMQARYYDPAIGRFYSSDPAETSDIHSINRYTYANNNPYKYVDPDGREAMSMAATWGLRIGGGITMALPIPGARPAAMVMIALTLTGDTTVNNESSGENTNPYDGPVEEPVVVVDGDGNAIPVGEGEQITGSPDGEYQQVRDKNGKPTGSRLDKGGHKGQADPQAQAPHAHQPGVTDSSGNPHLPINPPKNRDDN